KLAPAFAHYDRSDELLLMQATSRVGFEFDDHSFVVDQGAMVLLDAREKWTGGSGEGIGMIGVRVPRDALEPRIRLTTTLSNHPMAAQGTAALLAGYLREITSVGPSNLNPALATIVREHILDLTAVALGNLAGVTPKLGASTRFAALKLRAAIDNQLADPKADSASIAAEAGFSERHSNRILAQQGTSIRRLLIERRLAKCAETLSDPQQQHRSISSIAMGFGFSDLAHFSHVFKRRFGVTATEYRDINKT
ncbi:MAG TPA: helix-turn-helix domain-containing protein, partial [Ktedonobacterales bacterium]|nr:helix-turn-helix domain-containing protein [Ktedonobacterales bacterium]